MSGLYVPGLLRSKVGTKKEAPQKQQPAPSGPVPGMNDISKMTDMVCTFTLDDGRTKVFPFSMVYSALTVAFLGLVLKDGYLICDDDANLAANFEIPEVERLRGYKSMKLTILFENDLSVELDLTPTQMFIIVGKFEFDCSDPSGEFTCLPDSVLERMYLRNPDEMATLREEGAVKED